MNVFQQVFAEVSKKNKQLCVMPVETKDFAGENSRQSTNRPIHRKSEPVHMKKEVLRPVRKSIAPNSIEQTPPRVEKPKTKESGLQIQNQLLLEENLRLREDLDRSERERKELMRQIELLRNDYETSLRDRESFWEFKCLEQKYSSESAENNQ